MLVWRMLFHTPSGTPSSKPGNLRGRYPNHAYPKIFNDEAVGGEAKKRFDDAVALMKKIVADNSMYVKGVV
jgi:5-methyltetrahydrofolate--homocysteine methyltransferase